VFKIRAQNIFSSLFSTPFFSSSPTFRVCEAFHVMLVFSFTTAFVWAAAFGLVLAASSPLGLAVQHTPRSSEFETAQAISRALSALKVGKRSTIIKNSTIINQSWNNAVLFSL
jgi:hypothetical protein